MRLYEVEVLLEELYSGCSGGIELIRVKASSEAEAEELAYDEVSCGFEVVDVLSVEALRIVSM